MRILHLIPTLGGGGAEKQLAMLAPAMVHLGCKTGVAYRTDGANLDILRAGKADVLQLPQRSNHHPMQLYDILALVRLWRPDLIQTWLTQMDIMGGAVATVTGTPHVLSERSSAKMYAGSWKNSMRIFLGKAANAIIANSDGGANYWRHLGSARKVIVIPNAMKPLDVTEAVHPWDGRPYFVSAGRMSHEKNALTAISALIAALKAMPTMHAAIIGDGPERDGVAALISDSPVSNRMRLVGYSHNLGSWLQCATAYISTSFVEGHPNVVMEAAQVRCPLVLSDIPAHREAIGDGAVYVSAENVAGFADALLAIGQDVIAVAKRTELAFRKTEPLELEHIAERYVEFYRQILAGAF